MSKDILKSLTFGIKKTKKCSDKDVIDHGTLLRMREVPKDLRAQLSDLKKVAAGEVIHNPKDVSESQKVLDETAPAFQLFTGQKFSEEAPKSTISKKNKRSIVAVDEHGATKEISEKMQVLRRANRILTWGERIPYPLIDFDELSLPISITNALQEFEINEPTPIQMQGIPLMNQKRDILCCAPTGSGKTLAFAIPVLLDVQQAMTTQALTNSLLSIVLEPTTELALQTYRQFVKYGHGLNINIALFDSEKVPDNANILVSTPNRLVHHVKDLDLKHLLWLVVDESDRLFDTTEGPERCFRAQLATIYRASDNPETRRAFFSATFSYEVEEWCKINLNDVAMVCVGHRNSSNANVTQQLVFTGSEHGKIVALRELFTQGFEPPALIFVQSKERAREVSAAIAGNLPPGTVTFISSEKTHEERDHALEGFRSGRLWVLVCTELMGRGIDVKNVNLVVNFDLPTSIISYIHRVGRTGRAGRSGRAITFFTESDKAFLRPVATVIHQAGFDVPPYTLVLKKVSRNDRKDLLRRAPKRRHILFLKKGKKGDKFKKQKSENANSSSNKDHVKKTTSNKVKTGKVSKKMNTADNKSKSTKQESAKSSAPIKSKVSKSTKRK